MDVAGPAADTDEPTTATAPSRPSVVLCSELERVQGKPAKDPWFFFRQHPFSVDRIVCSFCYPDAGVRVEDEFEGSYSSRTSGTVLKIHLRKHHSDEIEQAVSVPPLKRARQSLLEEHVHRRVTGQRKVTLSSLYACHVSLYYIYTVSSPE